MLTDEQIKELRRLYELRIKRDEDKAALESSEEDYREAEAEMWAKMDSSGHVGTLKADLGEPFGVVSFDPQETYYGRVLDLDAALKHFDKQTMTKEYTKTDVRKGRINELVRGLKERGEQMPPGIDYYARRYIRISAPK